MTYQCRHCGAHVVKLASRWLDANNREDCRGDLLHWGVPQVPVSPSPLLKGSSLL